MGLIMMPQSIVVLLVVTGLIVEPVCGSPTCFLSPLYPHGPAVGDTIKTGDDETFTVQMDDIFKYYGSTYSTLHPSTNGVIGVGTDIWTPTPHNLGSDRASIASYRNDHNLDLFGDLFYRKVNLTAEPGILCLIKQDAIAIDVDFEPTMVFITTWKNAAPFDGPTDGSNTTTHQIVLASDNETTLSIFNYGRIDWEYIDAFDASHSAMQFDKGNSQDLANFPISMTDEMANVADYSNIGHPGRIVMQVDGDIELPVLEKHVCRSCSTDKTSGNVSTFDGSQKLSMDIPSTKYIFSKKRQVSYADKIDPCKFMLRMVTNPSGLLSWFALSTGRHPTNGTKYKRNFIFDKNGLNSVNVRGHEYQDVQPIAIFPYYETIIDSSQCLVLVLDRLPSGIIASSPMCQYLMLYEPEKSENQIRIILSSEYDDKTIGMCQNNNGDPADDNITCKPRTEVTDLTEIGQNCSCHLSDKALCRKQQRW